MLHLPLTRVRVLTRVPCGVTLCGPVQAGVGNGIYRYVTRRYRYPIPRTRNGSGVTAYGCRVVHLPPHTRPRTGRCTGPPRNEGTSRASDTIAHTDGLRRVPDSSTYY